MLVVFDLDFTLWDCGGVWCDLTNPPYKKLDDYIIDSENRRITLYPEVYSMLAKLRKNSVLMALASRTSEPIWARELLQLFRIDHFFSYKEIYPSAKTVHFDQLKIKSNFDYTQMYFFDDEYRNIEEVSALGVNCFHVKFGVTMNMIFNFIGK